MAHHVTSTEEIERLIHAIVGRFDSREAPILLLNQQVPSVAPKRPKRLRGPNGLATGAARLALASFAIVMVGVGFGYLWSSATGAQGVEPSPDEVAARRSATIMAVAAVEQPRAEPIPRPVAIVTAPTARQVAVRDTEPETISAPRNAVASSHSTRALPQRAGTASARSVPTVEPGTSGVAVRLTGVALERALAEDRIGTRRLNEAELERIKNG